MSFNEVSFAVDRTSGRGWIRVGKVMLSWCEGFAVKLFVSFVTKRYDVCRSNFLLTSIDDKDPADVDIMLF